MVTPILLVIPLVFAASTLAKPSSTIRELVKWVPFSEITDTTNLIAGGYEQGLTNYVARGKVAHEYKVPQWAPGKFKFNQEAYNVRIAFKGKEYVESNFEVLTGPPGATSWVAPTSLKSEPIRAGNDPATLKFLYICQARVNGLLMIGKADDPNNDCHIPFDGTEHKSTVDFKLLVEN
ncbi:hypothetical protein Ocin01_13511 [Orchesella cincta]|uniref:Uncharacterized protein n=1 Tax=Orchesella cincta TaxID=48709 RepID=A0A1D2MJJ3_ORCCI|nr:hypothetical protein Ocin01_13511 [Orchesella cincta]